MRPIVLPAVVVTMLLSYPLAQAHDDRDRGRGPHHPHREQAAEARVAGWGKLRNRAQQMCLDAAGWAAQGSANALLWSCNNDPDHVWFFAPTGEIKNAESGLCLTAADRPGQRGPKRGDDVGVDRCDGSRSQLWTVAPRGRDAFEVRNGRRGLCLDVDGRRGAQGDDVLLWACDGGVDQTWGWEPVSQPPPRTAYRPSHPGPRVRRGQQPVVQPMDPPAFQALLTAIRGGSFSANQMAVIEEAAAYHFFLVAQLREIVKSLSFSGNQVRAVELIAPRLVDLENGFTLLSAFTFSRDQEQVKRILERAREAQTQAQARR